MKHIIAGTAGHIDHGKSALVRALTGIEPDRWEEEKRRGISIDLGFAYLDLGEGLRVAFVDVPGHERFVKNMLAGAGGVDLVLLVIAADEAIKPQTREHFDICRLLGIRHGIVVLTKADLVDAELLDLVRLEVEDYVAGSFLEGAPVVAVSSVTGAGLDELKQRIREAAAGITAKDSSRHTRLPIDRSFSMRGFGTVVTGTLVSGRLRREQEVEIHPGGLRARVRGLQVHGASADEALAGQRAAVNLSGVETAQLARGMTLAEPGRLRDTRTVDCRLTLLSSAKPLKHGAPVHFHAWTAETPARVLLLDPPARLAPGGTGQARLELREPVLLLPGDRFIVRMFSPVVTIGGGTVIDIAPPPRLRRPAAAARALALENAPAGARLEQLVREQPWGLATADLAARTGLLEQDLLNPGAAVVIVPSTPPWLIGRTPVEAALAHVVDRLKAFHKSQPLARGMAKEEIRAQLFAGAPAFLLDAILPMSKEIAADGDLLRLAAHRVRYQQDEEQALGRIETSFERGGLAVPPLAEVLAACGVELARAKSLLQILLRRGTLVRISDDLVYHGSAIASLRGKLGARRGSRFTVAEFKDWTGVSRKYAIPLLEFLDRERVTRRDGDARVVL